MKNNKNITYRKQSGFTLIEAMVVVLIIGIVASLALSYYTNIIKNNAIDNKVGHMIAISKTGLTQASLINTGDDITC